MTQPTLTVVVPAFNEADTIAESIATLQRSLDTLGMTYEIIVVSDGSVDATSARAQTVAGPSVRVIDYPRNMGKGYALRTGSREARGEWVAWFDADLDLRPEGLARFLEVARSENADVVIGSKRHPESQVQYPRRRRVYSWLYQQLVRILFRLDVRDTQVGLKLFRRETLEAVLPVVLVKRYAFDLEMLAVARRFGFSRIIEQPITLLYRFTGSGMSWRAIANALVDTAAIFYRLRLLRYYDRKRALTNRIAASTHLAAPSLSVVVSTKPGETQSDDDIRATLHPDTQVVYMEVPQEPTDVGLMQLALARSNGEAIAFLDSGMKVGHGWEHAVRETFRDPQVAVVCGPTVPLLTGNPLHDAAAILTESRFGVGAARVRHHVGALREVTEFPTRNLAIRRDRLHEALSRGLTRNDDLCEMFSSRNSPGGAVLCSPDMVVSAGSRPVYRPYLSELWRTGVDRGRRLGRAHHIRMRHIAPIAATLVLATAVPALLAGGPVGVALGIVATVYLAAVVVYAVTIFALHRRASLTWLVVSGAVASHITFGVAMLSGIARRAGARLPGRAKRSDRLARPSGTGD